MEWGYLKQIRGKNTTTKPITKTNKKTLLKRRASTKKSIKKTQNFVKVVFF
jgi:hypothetical protein